MTRFIDFVPFCGDQTVFSAAEDYFTRDVLMSVLAGGHLAKMIEKLYLIIVILYLGGSGSLESNFWLLLLWTFGLFMVLYLAAHWKTITDELND